MRGTLATRASVIWLAAHVNESGWILPKKRGGGNI